MAGARELRFAFTFDDYETALSLFRDVFELETIMELDSEGARGVILRVPSATLELFDRGQGRLVDHIEVGRPLEERVRIAVNIDDLDDATAAVMSTGTEPVAEPVDTPWGDRNRRFKTPDGLQLTLFQVTER
jgi:catechol 2,3-dioxygenase-like lactoylglutathione lyase family enzyme